jgi:Ser/Thr protein kinase RdoA (MazF antagonist)
MAGSPSPSSDVLAALGLGDATIELFPKGLINQSWLVVTPDDRPLVLQRVNPMFPTAINTDIDVVTRHLAGHGLRTPRLIPTPDGRLFLEAEDAVWRQLTYIPGNTYDVVENSHQADGAGALLGRFHRAAGGLEHTFANAHLRVHDTVRHLANLRATLNRSGNHPRFAQVHALAENVFELASGLPNLGGMPDRVVHGDPKISNIVFAEETDDALCFIDLDTLGHMPIPLELGDAFRSWCNPQTEDAAGAKFSMTNFSSAIVGYAGEAEGLLAEDEWRKIPAATLTITVELAARFCADALNESYFSWDATRFGSASDHNQARTKNQLELARSIGAQREQLEAEVTAAFD